MVRQNSKDVESQCVHVNVRVCVHVCVFVCVCVCVRVNVRVNVRDRVICQGIPGEIYRGLHHSIWYVSLPSKRTAAL